VVNHLQQPRKPTDNSVFSQIRARVIATPETTSTLPCRGGGGCLLHSLSPITARYRLFGRLERIHTHITLVDIAKRPLLM
jgi:hypothetical protein